VSAAVGVPASITTPDTVQTGVGTLEFGDGAPTPDKAERLILRLHSPLQPFFDKSLAAERDRGRDLDEPESLLVLRTKRRPKGEHHG
jgi:hypothetical protein